VNTLHGHNCENFKYHQDSAVFNQEKMRQLPAKLKALKLYEYTLQLGFNKYLQYPPPKKNSHSLQHLTVCWILGSHDSDYETRRSTAFWVVLSLNSETAKLAAIFSWFLTWLTLHPTRWRQHVPLKCWVLSELNDIITHKTVLFT
jgi:hypothetical protein